MADFNQTYGHYMKNLVYINRNLLNNSTKVLINPNFKRNIHVNPNFKTIAPPFHEFSQTNANRVYVNPNLVKCQQIEKKVLKPPVKPLTQPPKKPILVNRFTKINKPTTPKLAKTSNAIVKTKTKLIRNNGAKSIANAEKTKLIQESSSLSLKVVNPTPFKLNKQVIITKSPKNAHLGSKNIVKRYKLIKVNKNVEPKKDLKSKYRINRVLRSPIKRYESPRRSSMTKNKFKYVKETKKSPLILKTRFKLTRKACLMQLDPKNGIIKNTKFKLIRSASKVSRTSPLATQNAGKKPSDLGRRKSQGKAIQRPKINRRKLRKNNIPCEIYNRTGFCKGISKKSCPKSHDPNKVQICPKFLQGACQNTKCLLSHKVLPEKMPTCKFYLEGLCHKEDCPYLHVKLSKDAPICSAFLQGFCPKGVDCDQRHQFLCPDYEKDGKCPKKYCRYPHGSAVRQYTFKLMRRIARNVRSNNKRETLNCKNISKREELKGDHKVNNDQLINKEFITEKETKREVEEGLNKGEVVGDSTKRYYECESSKSGCSVEEQNNAKEFTSLRDRPKLGTLPSFISFDNSF